MNLSPLDRNLTASLAMMPVGIKEDWESGLVSKLVDPTSRLADSIIEVTMNISNPMRPNPVPNSVVSIYRLGVSLLATNLVPYQWPDTIYKLSDSLKKSERG